MPGMSKQPNAPLDNLANAAQQAQGFLKQGVAQSQQTTSGQMMQLGQNLQQQQGAAAQSAVNRGIGNTSVMNSLSQQPLQTYNLAAAQVQNQGSERLAQLYQQLAQLKLQGGEDQLTGGVNLANASTAQQAQKANAAVQTQTSGYGSIRPDAGIRYLG